jgi:hypothetical protein
MAAAPGKEDSCRSRKGDRRRGYSGGRPGLKLVIGGKIVHGYRYVVVSILLLLEKL